MILFSLFPQHLTAAHKDWVCALDFLSSQNVLLSGCRGGALKLWQVDSCSQICEFCHTAVCTLFVLHDHLGGRYLERLLVVTDVLTTRAVVILSNSRLWRWLPLRLSKPQLPPSAVFLNNAHPDDHARQTTDTPGLKLFTKFALFWVSLCPSKNSF